MTKIIDNFNVRSPIPIDERFVSDLNIDLPYEGLISFNKNDKKLYIFINDNFKYLFQDVEANISNLDIKVSSIAEINVKLYGAKGDGLTDDTIAIQNALNDGEGKTVILPTGVYIISSPLTIKKNTTLMGNGINSVIKLKTGANCDILKTENFDMLKGTDTHNCGIVNITLKDFIINGNHFASPETYNYTINNNVGHGLQCYCGNLKLENLIITNTPENGLYTEWNTYDSPNNNLYGNESKYLNVIIQFSGKHGWEYHGAHDSLATNIIIATSSCAQTNTYYNFYAVDKGNFKIVNSHFYSVYGTLKPKYSVYLSKDAYSFNFSNCHIEGGYTASLCLENKANVFENCFIYASFGICDIIIKGFQHSFKNCQLNGKASDGSGVSGGAWQGAILFQSDNSSDNRNNYFDVYLMDTYLTNNFTNTNGLNTYNIRGYNSSYPISGGNIVANFDLTVKNKSDNINILGDFGSQSIFKSEASA